MGSKLGLKQLLVRMCVEHRQARKYRGCGGVRVLHPQSFTQSENLRVVRKFNSSEKGRSFGMISIIRETIPYNWITGSYSQNRNYLRDNVQGYVTLTFRPSERMIIVSQKFLSST